MLKHNLNEEKIETLLSKSEIPIIDLAHSGTDERPSRSVVNRVANQLQKAFSEKGLAFLVNHGICDEKLQTAWAFMDSFCDLPVDIQELYLRKDDNHGYIKPGQERFEGKKMELRHAFNICTLNEARLPEEYLLGFSEHMEGLINDYKSLSSLILQALAIGLDLPINYFQDNHTLMLNGKNENETTLRLLYYPPIIEDDNKCELIKGRCQYSYQRCAMDRPDLGLNEPNSDENDRNDTVTRCGAHCDYGTITFLSQDSEGGLEVKLPGIDKWKRVGHLPGAILINTGEMLNIWSNKKYAAIEHRVIIPEQSAVRDRGRHSIAFFCHPDNDVEICPIELPSNQPEARKKERSSSFKVAKDKVSTAYHLIQQKFKQTYNS